MTRYLEPVKRTCTTVRKYVIKDVYDAKLGIYDTMEEARAAVDFSKDQYISTIMAVK